jgi:acyl-CoA synthetase (AMP-forming)/AMP-acid ligase II
MTEQTATLDRIRRATLGDALARHARRTPDRPAIIGYDAAGNRSVLSYAELDALACQIANGLMELGVQKGDRVMLFARNSPWVAIAYWSALKAGAVITPMNPTLTEREIEYQLNHAGPTAVIIEEPEAERVQEMLGHLPHVPQVLTFSDQDGGALRRFAARYAPTEPDVDLDGDDPALLVYTSGTEDHPKGVILQHRNFLASTTPTWVYTDYVRATDVFLLMAPMYTVAGIGTLTTLQSIGATVVCLSTTAPDIVLDVITAEAITNTSQTPAFYARLVESDKFDSALLGTLRHCHTYGGLIARSVIARFATVAPNLTWATYWGQSELTQLGSVGYFRTLDDVPEGDLRWIGRPMPHLEVRVVDDNGNDVAPGEEGELICRSPSVMAGYFNDPERTAEVIRGGWLHTGDIVRMDATGQLFFHDRKKDMIKTGGMNVSSLEVETVVMDIPGVREVAVVGLPDDRWSEVVTAFVVRTADGAVDEARIRDISRKHLAAYKVPKAVRFVEALPRDEQGKVRKRMLRDSA